MTLKFLLYETFILGIDIAFRKGNERISLEIIAENLMIFCKILWISKTIKMQEQFHFCSHVLNSLQKIIEHYGNLHKVNVENSPMFESYVDVISKEPSQFFMEQCKYCNDPPFTDPKVKARYYVARHLKLHPTNQENLLIRRF